MLRTRLHLGLLPLLALVVGTGIYAIVVCRQMAQAFTLELRASFEASLAGERMRAAAARADGAAFKRELLQQAQAAAGTAREPQIAAIDRAYDRWMAANEAPPASGPGALAALARRDAALRDVAAAIDQLQQFDYAAARAAEARSTRLAATSVRVMGWVIVAAFLFCSVLAGRMVRTQRTMEATLNAIPDPLLVVGRDGRRHASNPAAQALASAGAWDGGYPPELDAPLREVLASGRSFLPSGYEHLVSVGGATDPHHYLPRILPIGDPVSGFGGAAVLLQDVTRFRLLDDAKTNLVGTVSHELKTPLTSLRMAAYLLLEPGMGGLQRTQRELLEGIRDDADRLLRLLNDLLDLTRLESGVAALHLRATPVKRLLEDMAREIRALAAGNAQTVAVEAAPQVQTVIVDVERIRHVFINLLSNACKYAPAGSTITLYAEPGDPGFVRCGVRDEGPGIPPESLGAIFEKFYRVPGQAKKGAGLGLAIAREIVVAHGGTIGVTSKPGQGSDFHFLLPGNTSPVMATILPGSLRAPA